MYRTTSRVERSAGYLYHGGITPASGTSFGYNSMSTFLANVAHFSIDLWLTVVPSGKISSRSGKLSPVKTASCFSRLVLSRRHLLCYKRSLHTIVCHHLLAEWAINRSIGYCRAYPARGLLNMKNKNKCPVPPVRAREKLVSRDRLGFDRPRPASGRS